MINVLSLCLIFAIGLALYQAGRIYYFSTLIDFHVKPWKRLDQEAALKVLFAGDSTVVGTGASDTSKSTAGWFGQAFRQASIENIGENGLQLKALADKLEAIKNEHYQLAILQIGANDIIRLTSYDTIKAQQARVLDAALRIADRVVILHSGDIGKAPLLIAPFSWLYTFRSLKMRDIYMQSQNHRVAYVDIYSLNKGANLEHGYAPDRFHLNEQGYYLWYTYIRQTLARRGWL